MFPDVSEHTSYGAPMAAQRKEYVANETPT